MKEYRRKTKVGEKFMKRSRKEKKNEGKVIKEKRSSKKKSNWYEISYTVITGEAGTNS